MSQLKPIQGNVESDQELIARYKRTYNNEILGVLFERYMHLVYGTCLKYLKDRETAKDAVMNIFEELVTKLRSHEVDNFKSWLFVVSKNHCLMLLRKESRSRTVEIPISLMQSEEEIHLNGVLEKEKHLTDLEDCLRGLADEQQQTVRMFYLDNKCYNEIAELTGLEWNKIRSHIQNGRRNLKICMDKKSDKN
ncbi:MAG TPA: sigma-70 family RNA polymerase sigma factor [Chitinophagaceae bacterium]|nr:sigma-70 family RNA polymerase sigma factor [Chitinophagaceae bacterium]